METGSGWLGAPSFLGARLDPDEPAVAGDGEPLGGPPGGGDGGGADRRLPGPVRRGRLPGGARGVGMHRRRRVAIARAAAAGGLGERTRVGASQSGVASVRQSGGSQ